LRRPAGAACVLAGAALLLHAAAVTVRGSVWQGRALPLLSARGGPPAGVGGESGAHPPGARFPAAAPAPPRRGEPLARVRIDRLGLDVAVAEGTDRRTLSLGPGHYEGSGLPGAADNCIIAGHRDGPFARLRSVRPGDLVVLEADRGVFRYRVDGTTVVDRDDASPLAPADRAILTLVTCHPFRYVGPAPRRFIVRASLID
jgi:sortase A